MLGSRAAGFAIAGGAAALSVGAARFWLDFPEPCRLALSAAQQSPALASVAGAGLHRRLMFWPPGGWTGSCDERSCRATIEIVGDRAGGQLVISAVREGDRWHPLALQATVSGGRDADGKPIVQFVDLLAEVESLAVAAATAERVMRAKEVAAADAEKTSSSK
jgi:hypothetical protein